MMKILDYKPEKLNRFVEKAWILICVLFALSEGMTVYGMNFAIKNVMPFIVLAVILFMLVVILYHKLKPIGDMSISCYLMSAVTSVYSAYRLISWLNLNYLASSQIKLLTFAAAAVVFFVSYNLLVCLWWSKLCSFKAFSKKKIPGVLFLSAALTFIFYYYIPAETYFASSQDYEYPYQVLAKAFVSNFIFWTFLFTFFLLFLKEKTFYKMKALFAGILVAIYVQYMFFNSSVSIVDGSSFDLKKHLLVAIVNTIVWLALIIGPVILAKKHGKKIDSFASYTGGILLFMHIFSYVMILQGADKSCFSFATTYYLGEEQFAVGSGSNQVVFIIDEADNKYIKAIAYELGLLEDMGEEPMADTPGNRVEIPADTLEPFKDFTVYTNTCSVYDFTNLSLLQMTTNFSFDNTLNNSERRQQAWNSDVANGFYDRYHEAGYKVNFYFFEYETSEHVIGKFDNARRFDPKTQKIQHIRYKSVRRENEALISYRIAPILFKGLIDLEVVSDTGSVIAYNNTNVEYHENKEFYENTNLYLGDNENYLIYQHLDGCHEPDDNVETFLFTLKAVEKYIQQMKELGVYDDATIIITSDHGKHDKLNDTPIPSTPIFIIKEPRASHEIVEFNDAPIYHTDLMATLLINANLYKDNDTALFGNSIYDFDENSERTRTWYNRYFDKKYPKIGKYNVYYGYTYTGNTKELERIVNSGEDIGIYPVPLNNE